MSLIKYIKNIVRHLKNNISLTLELPKLDKNFLLLQVSSDASFASNEHLSSQIGCLMFFKYGSNMVQPLYWTYYKANRFKRFIVGSKVIAFADAFHRALVFKYKLQLITGCYSPLTMLSDSLLLVEDLTKPSTTTEKRLKLDLQSVRNSNEEKGIEDVDYIMSEFNIAGALTKLKTNSNLLTSIENSFPGHPIPQ